MTFNKFFHNCPLCMASYKRCSSDHYIQKLCRWIGQTQLVGAIYVQLFFSIIKTCQLSYICITNGYYDKKSNYVDWIARHGLYKQIHHVKCVLNHWIVLKDQRVVLSTKMLLFLFSWVSRFITTATIGWIMTVTTPTSCKSSNY